MAAAALRGIRVVEFAEMISGPYCGKLFADLGADVVKVEPPRGDASRAHGPFPNSGPDPEHSALFMYVNSSKRSVVLDLITADPTTEDLATFKTLLERADVLIDNHSPQVLENLGLDWDALHDLNPSLVYVSITPYGRTGPRSAVPGDELTLIHSSGLANLLPTRSVDTSRAPVKMGGCQVGYHGAVAAAVATLGAVIGQKKAQRGRLIDVSLQEVMLNMVSPVVAGTRYHGTTWSRVPDRPPAMGRMQTRDGYVILNAFDDHHFQALREVMGNPEWCAGDEWKSMKYRANHLMDIASHFDAWMLKQQKDEIHHQAARKGIVIGPIATAEDVMKNPQFAARDFFVEVSHPEAGTHRYAGMPFRMSASPTDGLRPAPLLGQHNDELQNVVAGEDRRAVARKPSVEGELPLKGVRVLELCWVWAGPYAGMLLGDLGAEIIKVEGHTRTDLMRRSVVWPRAEPAPQTIPPNQGLAFNSVNRSKKGITLDLRQPEGVDLVRRLAAKSDIVIDNMRPGALTKLGLGYDDLKRVRQDIIVASSSGRGSEGPESDYLGYAMVHHGIGGGAYITGYPDDHPCHSTGDVDIMNATFFAFATLAALHHRDRTGDGQFIDYSQSEAVSSLIGEILLGYEMTSDIPERAGNAHPRFAPHNVYKAWGVDRWVALEVHSDDEFCRFAVVLGMPELARDTRFETVTQRKRNEAELDRIIEAWTSERDRDWMVAQFARADLMAAPSRDAMDLYADPHLRARGAFLTVDHPELGELELVAPPWKMTDCEVPARCAPLLGEHTDQVLTGILEMSDGDVATLRKSGIIL